MKAYSWKHVGGAICQECPDMLNNSEKQVEFNHLGQEGKVVEVEHKWVEVWGEKKE